MTYHDEIMLLHDSYLVSPCWWTQRGERCTIEHSYSSRMVYFQASGPDCGLRKDPPSFSGIHLAYLVVLVSRALVALRTGGVTSHRSDEL